MVTRAFQALTARRNELSKNEKGFTLIELLVVVIIIGILAAIAIPIFLGQQDAARDAAAKSDVTNLKTGVVAYLVTDGSLPAAVGDVSEFTASDGVTLHTIKADTTGSGFCVQATSATGTVFSATDKSSVTENACA